MRKAVLLPLLLACSTFSARSGEFYDSVLSLVNTNEPGPLPVRSPLLIDTNNTAAKITNVVNLADVYTRGEIGGIHLGMTMEQVVAAWGKPKFIHGRCFGGRRFSYGDTFVVFDPNSNSVMRIIPFPLPRLQGALNHASGVEQIESVLGKPTAREQLTNSYMLYLTYESLRGSLRVTIADGRLHEFALNKPPSKDHLKPKPSE